MRSAFFLFLVIWTAAAGAQIMYKCEDEQKRVTYSNVTCEKQGLKDAGPVADRTTTMPFVPAQKPAPAATARKPPAPKDDAEGGRGAVQIKPVVPLLEKISQ